MTDAQHDTASAAPSGAASPRYSASDFVTIDDAPHGPGYVVMTWTQEGHGMIVSLHRTKGDAEMVRDAIGRALSTWDGWSL